MNLKFALAFILYWLLAGMFFYFGASYMTGQVYYNENDYNLTITAFPANTTGNPALSVVSAGGFDKVMQTFLFAFTGIGLKDAPVFIQIILGFIQSSITVLGIVLIFGGS
jgi:hypothetical protein